MKKYFILLLIVSLVMVTACGKKENHNIAFKNEYEELNGKSNASGKLHRSITIPEDNPFEEATPAEIVKKIENKDSFYVYFGSRLCPWCRSVIESACKIASIRGISKIYYIDVWDDEGKEILRDKYALDENNKPKLEQDGTAEYKKFIEVFNDLLRDYTLTTEDGKTVEVGEKRIFAPNFVYIDKGVAKKLVTGKSDLLKDPRTELTEEIKKDQEKIFDDFFTEVCDESC